MNLDGFLLYLTRKLPKESTVKLNIALLKLFFDKYETFDQRSVDNFFLDKIHKKCKGSYLNRVRTALLHYSDYVHIPLSIDRFKELPSLQTTMSDTEIETLLSLPPPAGNSGIDKWYRWTMFWTIAAYSGIRPGNIASMTIQQVDFGQQCFILPDTKTEPARIPINPLILPQLEAFVKQSGTYLFPSTSKKKAPNKIHVDKADWCNNFKVRCEMMGLRRIGLRPYSLRHSLCTRLVDLNENIFRVAQVMNHRNIMVTEGYYRRSMKQAQLTIQKDPLGKRNMPHEVIKQIRAYIDSLELNNTQFDYAIENGRIEVKIKQ